MSTNQVKRKVKEYGKLLQRRGFIFSSIYLYGSYATGAAMSDSDIDVAVIVPRASKNWLQQEGYLWQMAPRVDRRIEPILIPQSDMKPRSISVIGTEVRRTGVRIL